MQTKISVVIPTFKRSKLLVNCLDKLVQQSLPKTDFEIIVVSDGEDQETASQLKPWFRKIPNLRYLSTRQKKGPAAARNLGWLSAKSPLVAFTDDDCLPDRHWLKEFVYQYHGESLLAFTGKTVVPLPARPTDFDLNTAGLAQAEFITANCACTKQALLATGGFDERFELAWREDSDLHFKLIELHIPIVKLEGAVVVHPVRPANWGVSIRDQRKAMFEALLFKEHPELYQQKIGRSFMWHYYLTNLLWLTFLTALIFNRKEIAWASAIGLGILLGSFAIRRLRRTSKSPKHVAEMLFTSIIIPSLSLYYRIYGAVKFRTRFI